LDNTLVAVPIAMTKDAMEAGAPHSLFRLSHALGNVGLVSPYDVTGDSQRFMVIEAAQAANKPITLVTNWMAELNQK